MKQVAKAVYRIELPTPFPVGSVNCYLIMGNPVTLIDPGLMFPPAIEELRNSLAALDLKFADVEQILLTHGHIDHFGMSQLIVDARNSPEKNSTDVYIHSEDLHRVVAHEDYVRGRIDAYIRIAKRSGVPQPILRQLGYNQLGKFFASLGRSIPQVQALSDNCMLESGIGPLRVVWVPGHTHGCVCFVSKSKKLIFTGDHILKNISSNPSLEFDSPGIPLLNYLQSLDKLYTFEDYRVFPGHRDEVSNLQKRIDELRDDIKNKLERLKESLSESPRTIYELSRKLYGDYDQSELVLALAETTDLARVLEKEHCAKLLEDRGILVVAK